MAEVGVDDIRRFARRRGERLRAERMQLYSEATRDAQAIIDMIVERFRPTRIVQWGSLLAPQRFREYSDIDIAVEGVREPERYSALLEAAEKLTRFPIDIVQLEAVEPEYRELMLERGRTVYER